MLSWVFDSLRLSESALFCLFATSRCEVLVAKPDADLFQECRGRLAAGKDPNEVVGDLLLFAIDFQNHGIFFEFRGNGVENDLDFALADGFLDAPGIALLDAAEGFFTIGEGDLIANLVAQAHGGLDSAVATTDDQDFLVDIVIRFKQAIHYLGQFLALDAEFPRAAALAERQHHGVRSILAIGRRDGEDAVLALLDVFHLFTLAHLEIRALQDLVPEGDQLFLAQLQLLEFSVQRKFHGTGQHEFLAGILGHGAADLTFINSDVVEFFLRGAEASADSRRPCTHDQHVVNVRGTTCAARGYGFLGNVINAVAALVDGVLDERQTAQLADDIHVFDGGFKFGRQVRHVPAHAGAGHDHGDGADRASFRAEAVADAFVSVHDDGFAAQHGQNIALRADQRACRTPDAVVSVDMRMLGLRAVGTQFSLLGGLERLLFYFFLLLQVTEHEEADDYHCEDECNEVIHNNYRGLLSGI